MNKTLSRGLVLAALGVLMVACSKKNREKPAELVDFRSTATIQRVWTADVSGAPKLRLGLGIAAQDETIFAAGSNGDVVALNAATGRRVWHTNTRISLSGGPGVGAGLVVAGGSKGDIIALDAATGAERWRTRINSEILAAPAISGSTVLVRSGDGQLTALRAGDGGQIWSAEQQVPRLSLRGTGRPLITGNMAVGGFDNGRVLALNLADGGTVWDVSVSPPAGKTELDRLVDIDSAVQVMDNGIYAVTYQGRIARLDRDSGTQQWSRETSSYAGFALDDEGVYVSVADGSLVKIALRTGVETWSQDVLTRRRLSAPAVLGPLVAVSDLAGYVHFFDKESGELAARLRPLGTRVTAPPLVVGDLMVIMDADGKIAALRIASTAARD